MIASTQARRLGNYELLEEIGTGGMGRVYRGRHSLIGREAAIKALLPRLSDDKEAVARFFNEARATTMVSHPGIVDILDFGIADDGSAYIVMELLEGNGLGDILASEGQLSESTICRYMRQTAGALDAAHRAGIIHRDLKPDNLFLVQDPEVQGGERIKVLDFGIAKLLGHAAQNVSKTATGAVLGSPLYMSPEQCEGSGKTTFRSDIYSLGCVMYEMAVGRPPFQGGGAGAIIAKHIYREPTPPSTLNIAISSGLNDLILSLMAKEPTERPASMEAVARALEALSDGVNTEPHASHPRYAGTVVRTGPRRAATAAQTIPKSIKETTHGSSSGQISPKPVAAPRSTALLIGGIALALAAVVGIAVLAQGGDDSLPDSNAAAKGADSSEAATGVVEIVDLVTFTITSEPAGALVRDSSRQLLGETPYTMTLDQSAKPEAFVVTQLGFEDAHLSIVADENRSEHVELEPISIVAHPDAPAAKKPAAKKPAAKKPAAKKPAAKKPSAAKKPAARDKPRKTDPDSSSSTTKKKKQKKSGFGETIDPLEE